MAGPSHGSSSPTKSSAVQGTSPQKPHGKKKKKPHATSNAHAAHRIEGHESSHDPNSVVLDRRLFAARKTQRLDLSIASHRSLERLPSPLMPFQVFPRAILMHEQLSGHHLREMWLTNHHISMLPPEIALFPQLRILGLAGNALSSLPSELAQLTSLEALYLERNAFRVIPETVAFPRQLRDLRLDHNALSVVPKQVTQLRLLQRLGLSHNRLTSLPLEMRRLLNLVELDLDHNCISSDGFPHDAIARLIHLERLGLDGNRLSERPTCLAFMPNARYVRLNGNLYSEVAPRRHDGYYQCMDGYQAVKAPTPSSTVAPKRIASPLDGIVDARDQNLVNAMVYQSSIPQL